MAPDEHAAGVFLFASINPSAWGVAGLAAMWGPMVTAFLGKDARRRWLALAVWFLAALMAGGSRGDTAIFAAVISVLGLVLLARRRAQWPAIAMGVIVVTVSAWMLVGTAQLTAAGRGSATSGNGSRRRAHLVAGYGAAEVSRICARRPVGLA